MTAKPRPDFDDAHWQSSSHAEDSRRVEIAFVDGMIGMRDSAQPDGPVLVFTPEEWTAFVEGVELGEFDVETLLRDVPPGA